MGPPAVGPALPCPARAGARRVVLTLSQRWMYLFLDALSETFSLAEACVAARVTLIEYLDGRQADPMFDRACAVFDHVADCRIQETVLGQAADGDIRAQNLYYKLVRPLAMAPPGSSPSLASHERSQETALEMASRDLEILAQNGLIPPLPSLEELDRGGNRSG